MRITLCEDDGKLNGGVPTLVILEIHHDNGAKERLPYRADRTIQDLFVDVSKTIPSEYVPEQKHIPGVKEFCEEFQDAVDKTIVDTVMSNTIQREDIVRCVKVHPREEGADTYLTLGNEYRVFTVSKTGYELIDDKSPNRIAFAALKDEVELVRKRSPKPKRGPMTLETTAPCGFCGKLNALQLKGNEYKGTCEYCHNDISIERKTQKEAVHGVQSTQD